MTGQAGRDLLLKISDGGTPAQFLTLGAARLTAFEMTQDAADVTPLGAAAPVYSSAAGRGDAVVSLQGLFKDSAAEEHLRGAADSGEGRAYKMIFPNGDVYTATFIVTAYRREGSHDGLESFAASLRRSGAGDWTLA